MQTAASTSLVLTEFSSSKRVADSQTAISYAGFYQQIASGLIRSVLSEQVTCELGDRLVSMAEHAHAFRRMDILEQVSHVLLNSPALRRYEAVGHYYQALCVQKLGHGDAEQAANLLERVTEIATPKYRLRAMVSLAANSCNQRNNQTALSLYCEAGRYAFRSGLYDPYATIVAPRMAAVISSDEGDHRGALAQLEKMFPLAHWMRSPEPHIYYDYLNSFAVELCAAGRLEEAKNVSEIAVASPFAPAYPEWRETREDIELRGRRASRSTVGLNPGGETVEGSRIDWSSDARNPSSVLTEAPAHSVNVSYATAEASNILLFPVREQSVASGLARSSSETREPARVFMMAERNKPLGGGTGETPKEKKSYGDLDGRRLLLKIMELTAAKDRTDSELLAILESIEDILFRRRDPGKR